MSQGRGTTETPSARDRQRARQVLSRDDPVVTSAPYRLGRFLYGGVLAFMALDNLTNLEERIEYARAKGAPLPEVTVPTASVGLLLGGVGVALWRLPSAAAAGVAWFFLSVTPVMHDFWNVDDDEQKQQELLHFLKNSALLGGALAFLSLGRRRE